MSPSPASPISELMSMEDMQGFLDHAVHDVRAVLRKISMSVEIGGLESADGAYPAIREGVAQGNAILAAIGTYSSAMVAAQYCFTQASLDLALDIAVAGLEGRIRETGGEIVRGPLPELVIDRERLTDLFRHLILNSLAYRSAQSPRVEIRAQQSSTEWVLSIRDNGIGIADKYQGNLFKPFFRLHGSEIPGVGLGLASCKRILEAHRGKIWVESKEGDGATFFASFPS